MLLVRNSPAEYKHIGAAELAYINAGIPVLSVAARRSVKWREILVDRQIGVLTLSYSCYGYVAYMLSLIHISRRSVQLACQSSRAADRRPGPQERTRSPWR